MADSFRGSEHRTSSGGGWRKRPRSAPKQSRVLAGDVATGVLRVGLDRLFQRRDALEAWDAGGFPRVRELLIRSVKEAAGERSPEEVNRMLKLVRWGRLERRAAAWAEAWRSLPAEAGGPPPAPQEPD